MKIILTKEELDYAREIGQKRQEFSKDKPDAHGFKGDGELIHIQGAEAELAVSKGLGLAWNAYCEDFKSLQSDVGKNIQVRSTDHPSGNLLVHPNDKEDAIFVLVRNYKRPEFEICGWLEGQDCKLSKYWRNSGGPFKKRPCYFIRWELLKPIEDLKVG